MAEYLGTRFTAKAERRFLSVPLPENHSDVLVSGKLTRRWTPRLVARSSNSRPGEEEAQVFHLMSVS